MDRVNELEATVQEKKLEVQCLEGIINYQQDEIECLQTLAHMPAPLSLPVSSLTSAAAAMPLLSLAGTLIGVATTFSSSTLALTVSTNVSSMGEKKSTKIPEPNVFTNGVKEPQFKHWLLQIKNKLVANADHFLTEAQRMTYV